MQKPRLSWQGIGISTDPKKGEPLSLHLQAYLRESADSADHHIILIADTMQVPNYQTLHKVGQEKAERIARRKGKLRKKSLERILSANGIRNIGIRCFSEGLTPMQQESIQSVQDLYAHDEEIRAAIISCVPKRLRERADQADMIAQYALTEIGLILGTPGVKFGHEKERIYDTVAATIHEKYGIGTKPAFTYSTLGLEYIPGKRLKVEPYSAIDDPHRLLLTDSSSSFTDKVESLPADEKKLIAKQLQQYGKMDDEPLHRFYARAVRPVERRIHLARTLLKAAAVTTLAISTLAGSAAYINHDIEEIRQAHMRKISVFGLNGDIETCRRAHDDALQGANEEIKEKYHINNHFNS